ncbi:aminoacyl nucleotide detoxifying acetyltransferase [Escherichia coli]|nr:aminoacyl nucleotide detoxifying acetyltransferase [Escherichia coli]GDN26613.1 aminoacyl nucleotide detoxifying acetyltransferase [Escherichia coli]
MSEIVIRHAETRDYEAIRQIHAQPEVYCNTLQVPHPSDHMWQERLADRPGIKQLVACIDGDVVGHLTIDVQQRHAAVMLPILVSVSTLVGRTAASPAP